MPCRTRQYAKSWLDPLFANVCLELAVPVFTTLLLICSHVFMTFAWYAHLKDMSGRPWFIAALVSWGVALADDLLQVPANRIGHATISPGPQGLPGLAS